MNNQIKTIFLLGALSALLIALGGYMGEQYLYLFAGLALVMNFVSYFWSDKIVLAMNRAQEVRPDQAPRLHAMVKSWRRGRRSPSRACTSFRRCRLTPSPRDAIRKRESSR